VGAVGVAVPTTPCGGQSTELGFGRTLERAAMALLKPRHAPEWLLAVDSVDVEVAVNSEDDGFVLALGDVQERCVREVSWQIAVLREDLAHTRQVCRIESGNHHRFAGHQPE